MIYPNGYDANVGAFEALLSEWDAVIADSECHPSIQEGISLSRAQKARFQHNDISSLKEALKSESVADSRIKMVVTQGVFIQDGGSAPLKDIGRICEEA